MSGTIRSRTEAQRDRHRLYLRGAPTALCGACNWPWPCPDRVAADDTLTDLANAKRYTDLYGDPRPMDDGNLALIPDPDSRD